MKYILGYVLVCSITMVAFVGCGNESAQTYSVNEEKISVDSINSQSTPSQTITTQGTRLVMYDESGDIEEDLRPTFIVEAESSKITSELNEETSEVSLLNSVLTNPHATIYTEDNQEFSIDAESGEMDDESQTATLLGSVQLVSGDLNLSMNKMMWDNISRVVESKTAVDVDSDWASLKASSMTLDTDSGLLTLNNVTGSITLGAKE
jgi:LPS export ABC transporter protein LptC